jgi:hypothetical protein
MQSCEMTKFRGEDSHPLCDPKLLQVETVFTKKSYEMKIFIESEALYGFDPLSFNCKTRLIMDFIDLQTAFGFRD